MERLLCQSAIDEEFLDVEEEILDVMEAENLHVIEEERSVPVSVPRKPKRFKLMAPLNLIRSGKMTDRSGNRKVTRHMTRKHVRSDGMVLNFDVIVPEAGADREKSNYKRKAQCYVFRLGPQPFPKPFRYPSLAKGFSERLGPRGPRRRSISL
jgi:hypothetical protein